MYANTRIHSLESLFFADEQQCLRATESFRQNSDDVVTNCAKPRAVGNDFLQNQLLLLWWEDKITPSYVKQLILPGVYGSLSDCELAAPEKLQKVREAGVVAYSAICGQESVEKNSVIRMAVFHKG